MEEFEKTMSRQQAAIEAERCLYCYDAPCQAKCPAHVPVPEFIQSIRSGNLHGARALLQTAHPLIETCGRICPEEAFCQSVCTRGKIDAPLRIRELHRFVTDSTDPADRMILPPAATGKVAIIGAGLAGLACMRELRLKGFACDLFEARTVGGVPSQEVSGLRYPREVDERETRHLTSTFATRVSTQHVADVTALAAGYDAVFVATGLASESDLSIEGMELEGVCHARELLRLMKSGVAKRYRSQGRRRRWRQRSHRDCVDASCRGPDAGRHRCLSAGDQGAEGLQEGDRRGDGAGCHLSVSGHSEQDRRYSSCGGAGSHASSSLRRRRVRRRCSPLPGSSFTIPLDTLVMAIGQRAEEGLFPELARSDSGLISVGETMETSVPGIFAGGDAVHGAQTVVEAVSDGKKAAESIAAFVAGGKR